MQYHNFFNNFFTFTEWLFISYQLYEGGFLRQSITSRSYIISKFPAIKSRSNHSAFPKIWPPWRLSIETSAQQISLPTPMISYVGNNKTSLSLYLTVFNHSFLPLVSANNFSTLPPPSNTFSLNHKLLTCLITTC